MATKKTPKPPVDHGPLVPILIERTAAVAKKYKDALKPQARPKLTKKGAALQALIDSRAFGCQTPKVAEAFAVLTGEPIQNAYEEPRIAEEDIVPGICFFLNAEDYPFSPGIMLISTSPTRLYRLLRTDTGNVKDAGVHPVLKNIRFATAEEIRTAMAKVPQQKAEILFWAIAKN